MMKLLALIAFLAMAAVPSVGHSEIINGIAAIINDEPVTMLDVDKEAAVIVKEAERRGPVSDAAKKQAPGAALNRLVDKALVDQKIKELNIKVSEEEVRQSVEEVKKQNNLSQEKLVAALTAQGLTFDQYKAQFKEQLERLRLMSQEVRAKIQVTEREMSDFYKANPTRFGGEEHFQARQIFFKLANNPPSTEVKRVMSLAVNVLNEARNGKDFVELAKKYSDDPRVSTDGGDLGDFKKGEMLPEIEETVVKMNVGNVSDLVITPAGFHIIKLEKKYMGAVKPFEEAKAELEEILYKKKSEERFTQWLDELRKSAAIDIKGR